MRKLAIIFLAAVCAGLVWGHAPERGSAPQTESARARSLERLVAAADSGNARAMYHLSALLESGREGFAPDSARALELLYASAAEGFAPAMNYLGYAYAVPLLGLEQNADSALVWMERAATAPEPDPKAISNLGILLFTGSHVRRDFGKARYWLTRAAEAGVRASYAPLAHIYLEGLETPRDTAQGLTWLRRGATLGDAECGDMLAALVLPGLETLPADSLMAAALEYYHEGILTVALPLLERAAASDDALACAILGQCYAEGIGVPYDYAKALNNYAKAATLGDPHAAFILAETLETDPGLRDLPELKGLPATEALRAQSTAAGITDAPRAVKPLRP